MSRYTTIMDIREIPKVYRNKNACLLYLHMCLAAGYEVGDLDKVTCSLRQLSASTGLTLSAIRHALHILIGEGLLKVNPHGGWIVKKWMQREPARRGAAPTASAQPDDAAAAAARQREEDQRRNLAMWAAGTTGQLEYLKTHPTEAAARGIDVEKEKMKLKEELREFDRKWREAYDKRADGDAAARQWMVRNRAKIEARAAFLKMKKTEIK